ncbi:MAG: hypothetical protein LBQ78_05560 [Tannerellaceae bacterium]|jgi:hypothetical protein|nr:hypothetical protein [Tannerellaceae bacterium]
MDILEQIKRLGGGNLTQGALEQLIEQAGNDRYDIIRACIHQLTDKEVLKMKNGEWLKTFFFDYYRAEVDEIQKGNQDRKPCLKKNKAKDVIQTMVEHLIEMKENDCFEEEYTVPQLTDALFSAFELPYEPSTEKRFRTFFYRKKPKKQ